MNQQHSPSAGHSGPEPQLIEFAPLAGRVAVWRCDLHDAAATASRIGHWLAPEEQARAARFGSAGLRERYITGRASLRSVLAGYLGVEPASVPIRRGARGRPQLQGAAPPDFNVTHTGATAVFAIGFGLPATQRVGVDIESAARNLNVPRLARKLLTENERRVAATLPEDAARLRFLETWTCKEAMSKATGDGLRAPFGRIAVEPHGSPRLISGPGPYVPPAWELHRVPIGKDFIVTIAVWRT